MKIYILADELSRGKALDAATRLRAKGYEPVHSIGSNRERVMKLVTSDAVALVDGWNKSKTCQVLMSVSLIVGMPATSVEGWIENANH